MAITQQQARAELARRELLRREASRIQQQPSSLIDQAVSGPGIDLARGFLQGSQDVVRPAASVAEFLRVPDKVNIFKQAEQNAAFLETGLPQSTSSGGAKFINELIGRAPGLAAEFAQGGALLRAAKVPQALSKVGAQKALPTAELAITNAIGELREGAPEALEAAKDAGTIGFAFGAASPLVAKGFELFKHYGKATARKLLEVTTNNIKLAEDFVKRPFRYNLRFSDKTVKTVEEARLENKVIKKSLDRKHSAELESIRQNQKIKKEELFIRQNTASSGVKEQAKQNVQTLTDKNTFKVDEVRAKTKDVLKEQTDSLGQTMNDELSGVLDFANAIKQQEGNIVGDAIKGIVAINPQAGIPLGKIIPKIKPILNEAAKRGLVKIDGLTAKPVTSGQRALSSRINRWVSDLTNTGQVEKVTQKGNPLLGLAAKKIVIKKDVPLEVLNGLKNDARLISQRAYKVRDNNTGKIFSELSKEINPAKIAGENKALAQKLEPLVEANAKFSKMIEPYNDLVKLITTVDGNGQIVANSSSVVSAVKNNNIQVINRLRKIDASLTKDQQVLPKIRKHISDVNKAKAEQIAMLKATKQAADVSKKQLLLSQRKIQKNIEKSQRSERFELNQEQRASLVKENQRRIEEMDTLQKSMDDNIEFLKDQDSLRAFQGKGLTGLLQRIFAFGEILPFFTGGGSPLKAGAGLLGALGLSPNVIGKGFQNTARAIPGIESKAKLISELGRKSGTPKLLQQFLTNQEAGE